MSAFLSSSASISALVQAWIEFPRPHQDLPVSRLGFILSQIYFTGNFYAGTELAEEKCRELNTDTAGLVFQYLLDENLASLMHRYPEDDRSGAPSSYQYKRQPIVADWLTKGEVWQLCIMADSYAYQSCEHDDWPHSVAYAIIQDLRKLLLGLVAHKQSQKATESERLDFWSWEGPSRTAEEHEPSVLK